jgi:hypothetical protein
MDMSAVFMDALFMSAVFMDMDGIAGFVDPAPESESAIRHSASSRDVPERLRPRLVIVRCGPDGSLNDR